MNMTFFYAAIAIMLIVILQDILKKKLGFDMNKVDVLAIFNKKSNKVNSEYVIKKTTGTCSLVMLDPGENKATVMATLRQITGIDYNSAKTITNTTPSLFISNISKKEAELTKQALEFVGAKIDIV